MYHTRLVAVAALQSANDDTATSRLDERGLDRDHPEHGKHLLGQHGGAVIALESTGSMARAPMMLVGYPPLGSLTSPMVLVGPPPSLLRLAPDLCIIWLVSISLGPSPGMSLAVLASLGQLLSGDIWHPWLRLLGTRDGVQCWQTWPGSIDSRS